MQALGESAKVRLTESQRALTRAYVLSLREGGGFCGSAFDRVCDCEYTFYGLLALGWLCE